MILMQPFKPLSKSLRKSLSLVLMTCALIALSACGFALRGAVVLPFSSIYIGLPDNSSLAGELKRTIRSNGHTTILNDATQAQITLDVLSEQREKTILSLNSQGRVREFALHYHFRFRVKNVEGKELLAPTMISLQRRLSYNEEQALAKEAEEALLYRDMQSDLVQQIVRRLAKLKVD
jgi:LPS-assembly lipoprotein